MSRDTILIAWAIHDFRQTKHRFTRDLSRELLRIVETIIASIFRSVKSLFTRETILSAESIVYSSDWAIDADVFRRDAKQFYENTAEYRQFQIFFSFVNFRSSIDQSSFDNSVTNNSSFIDVTSDRQLNLDSAVFRNNRFRDVNDSSVTRTSTVRLSIDFVSTLSVSSLIDFDEVISRNTKTTTDISIEEVIYSQSIESSISAAEVSAIVDMSLSQNQLQQMIDRALNNYVQRHSFQSESTKSSDSFESSEQQDQDDENIVDNIKWNSVDLDFFDFFYDDKSLASEASLIVNTDKNIYFRDVHLFIVRAKKMTLTRDEQLIRNNLWLNLRDTALKWWTDELSDVERRLARMIMTDQEELSKWISLLHARFKQSINVIMNSLMQQRYTLRDAVAQRESREYAQKIIRLIKDVDMINVLNQLNLIYNDIDVDVKIDTLRRSKNSTTINEMLNDMNEFKHDWWIRAAKLRSNINSQNNRQMSRQDARQQQFDQYDNRTLSSNFQRRFYSVNQSYRSNAYQNNQYIDYSRNYDFQSYDYQNQSYQDNQEYRSNQDQFSNVTLFTSSVRLQITVDSTIISTSNASSSDNQNQNQRRSFQSKSNQSYRSDEDRHDRSQRVYQASVKNEMSDTLSEQTEKRDDTDKNENQNIYHDQHEKNSSWLDNDTQYESWYNDYDINFVICDFDTVKAHKCQLCNVSYSSKNKLFKHLRIDCWQQSVNHISVASESITSQSASRQLIEFSAQVIADDEQKFRECHYAVIKIKSSINFEMLIDVCLDTDCFMTIADRKIVQQYFSDSTIKQLSSSISMRNIDNIMHHISDYVVLTLYLDDQLIDKIAIIDKFQIEVHLVDDLKINIFIDNDALIVQQVKLNLAQQTVQLDSCQNFVALINVLTRQEIEVKRIIRVKSTVIVSVKITINVSVSYNDDLSADRDFLFESQCAKYLDDDDDVFAHIVDVEFDHVMIKNTINYVVQLFKRARLDSIIEFNQQRCYNLTSDAKFLATEDWTNRRSKSWKSKLDMIIATAVYAISVEINLSSRAIDVTVIVVTTSVVTSISIVTSKFNSHIDSQLESILSNDITVYDSSTNAVKLAAVVNEFPQIWDNQDTIVNVFEIEWMSIDFKLKAESLKSARVYLVDFKKRTIIDIIFDKMHVDDKMIWINQSTSFSFSMFVIWRDTLNEFKSKVMIDIRNLNKVTIFDIYSMSLQADIISAIADHSFISIVNVVDWFHQFKIRRSNRHKFTIVSHRDQKQFNVTLMNFKSSSFYVQRQTDQMLRFYREFFRVYMNDIIIFSKILKEHIAHFRQIFQLFASKRVNLALNKSFLSYSFIMLLEQRVDSLDLSISTEKIAAIIFLRFSQSLKNLKHFLDLIDWLRHCINRYAQLVETLQVKKTTLIKQLSSITIIDKALKSVRKSMSSRLFIDKLTTEELIFFRQLQDVFSTSIFLAHFNSNRQLYIDFDVSKRWNFVVMIYHVACDSSNNISVSRLDVQSILFLSKLLNSVEQNYWSTELEVTNIVWVIKRVRHLIDSIRKSSIIIYTDHSTVVSIFRQTTLITFSIDKLNFRLVRVSQYLSSFNIVIRHKSDKSNVISNVLSRLSDKLSTQSNVIDKAEILDVLYEHSVNLSNHELRFDIIQNLSSISYHVTLIEMSNDFKQRLKTVYTKDEQWKKILNVITFRQIVTNQAQSAITDLAAEAIVDAKFSRDIRFKLREDLIYYASNENKKRLCVSTAMKQEIFKIAHDLSNHDDFHRIYDRIVNSMYFKQLTKRLRNYIEYCSECQLNQIKRHSFYESLQLIVTSTISFHTLTIDFILRLSSMSSDDMNCIMTMTDKFTKRCMTLFDKTIYNAKDWINVLITTLMTRDWDVSREIISDRDRKFMSLFWQIIFKRIEVTLLIFTVYHSQIDEQSERINQTIEITLRFWLFDSKNTNWLAILLYLTISHNNVTNVTIDFALNELIYDFRINDTLNMLKNLFAENYFRLRQIKRESAKKIMIFANVMHKRRYDEVHIDIQFKIDEYAFLKLHADYTISDLSNHKLNQQRVDSFKIIDRIDTLTYRLELSFVMQIHLVIFIAQLKFASSSNSDSYQRSRSNNSSSITTKNDDSDDFTQTSNYEIERLLNRRIISTNRISYLVKWKNYDSKHNVWYFLHALDSFKNLVDDYDRQHLRSAKAIDATAIQTTTATQSIIIAQSAVIEQLLLKASSSTKLVRQSTREERDERDRDRSRDKFRETRTWELEWLDINEIADFSFLLMTYCHDYLLAEANWSKLVDLTSIIKTDFTFVLTKSSLLLHSNKYYS